MVTEERSFKNIVNAFQADNLKEKHNFLSWKLNENFFLILVKPVKRLNKILVALLFKFLSYVLLVLDSYYSERRTNIINSKIGLQ